MIFFLIPVSSFSATIKIPSDYPAVQQGIDMAINGDTILVDPGTYMENINFKGKAITVMSSGGAGVTVIDGGKPVNPDFGSVVTFNSGEDFGSILDGFTLTNGTGTFLEFNPSYWHYYGGGIYCNNTSPTITNNTIIGNVSAITGGGICCEKWACPLIKNNTISNNIVSSIGGGISCLSGSSPTIVNNTINENTAFYFGGGIYCHNNSSPSIKCNTIADNDASFDGGGLYFWFQCSPIIQNNIIHNNVAFKTGGGIHGQEFSNLSITGNIITNNSAQTMDGGGISFFISCKSDITNNIIVGNSAYYGGGISCTHNSKAVSINNTIHGNSALTKVGGGISCYYKSSMTVKNSIVWRNPLPSEIDIRLISSSSLTISYSDLSGGKNSIQIGKNSTLNYGQGMIDLNPLFKDPLLGDFHLQQDPCQPGLINPCVDAGMDTSINMGFHYAWTRTDQVFDSGIIDLGYHYGVYPFTPFGLSTDKNIISQSTGGQATLSLDALPGNAGRKYLIFSSLSGTTPGFTPPPGLVEIPITWDAFTNLSLNFVNTSIFQNFYASLDVTGQSKAAFYTLGPIHGCVGLTLYFAYGLDLNHWDFASNPVSIEIAP